MKLDDFINASSDLELRQGFLKDAQAKLSLVRWRLCRKRYISRDDKHELHMAEALVCISLDELWDEQSRAA